MLDSISGVVSIPFPSLRFVSSAKAVLRHGRLKVMNKKPTQDNKRKIIFAHWIKPVFDGPQPRTVEPESREPVKDLNTENDGE